MKGLPRGVTPTLEGGLHPVGCMHVLVGAAAYRVFRAGSGMAANPKPVFTSLGVMCTGTCSSWDKAAEASEGSRRPRPCTHRTDVAATTAGGCRPGLRADEDCDAGTDPSLAAAGRSGGGGNSSCGGADGGAALTCRNQAWPSAAVGLSARRTAWSSASCCEGLVRETVSARRPLPNEVASLVGPRSVKAVMGKASSEATGCFHPIAEPSLGRLADVLV